MNTILTDDERFEIWKATETDNRFVLMAEHEAAVLAKLAQQEPVTWASFNKQGDVTSTTNKRDSWRTVPLYTHPAPQQADHQRVPDDALRQARDMLENWAAYVPAYFAEKHGLKDDFATLDKWLAAAPEAPAQGEPRFTIDQIHQALLDHGLMSDTEREDILASLGTAPEAPAQASAVDERAAFEDWVLREYATVRREHGELRWYSPSVGAAVGHAWSGWQARAALAQKGGDA